MSTKDSNFFEQKDAVWSFYKKDAVKVAPQYGNPKLKMSDFTYFTDIWWNWVAFVSKFMTYSSLYFYSLEHIEKLGFLEDVEIGF